MNDASEMLKTQMIESHSLIAEYAEVAAVILEKGDGDALLRLIREARGALADAEQLLGERWLDDAHGAAIRACALMTVVAAMTKDATIEADEVAATA